MPQLNPEFFVSQLFWLVVTFSFLLVFLWRISLPRISLVLEKRERKIKDDIAAAKKMKEEAEDIQKEIDIQFENIRNKTSDLIKETSHNLQNKTNEELNNLEKELENKLAESSALIEKNKNNSLNQINKQIEEITKLTLSKISNLDVSNDDVKKTVSSIERKVN